MLGDGPTCLAISGGPGLDWKYLRSPELEKQLRVVYVEPIGSGASQRLAPGETYTLARYVDQVERLRVVLRLDKLCVIGHSHGGTIAARYAIDHPDKVSALVLYSAPDRLSKDFVAAGVKSLERWKDEAWYADARKAFDTDPKTDAEATALWPRAMKFLFADYAAHANDPRGRADVRGAEPRDRHHAGGSPPRPRPDHRAHARAQRGHGLVLRRRGAPSSSPGSTARSSRSSITAATWLTSRRALRDGHRRVRARAALRLAR